MESCSREENVPPIEVQSISQNRSLLDTLTGDTLPTLIKQFPVRVRLGTHLFDQYFNCGLNLACGPCPGLCIQIARSIVVDHPTTPLPSGHIKAKISIRNNAIHMIFLGGGVDVGDGTTIITNDYDIGLELSTILGEKKSIVLKQGVYKMDYSNNSFGEVDFSFYLAR